MWDRIMLSLKLLYTSCYDFSKSETDYILLISWDAVKNAQGYNVLWGIAPDKLYHSWLLYGKNKLNLPSLNAGQTYYIQVEAFNENGVGKRSQTLILK